jgi:hypothetical protein
MECARFDWKGYALGELSAAETAECDRHVHACERCRVEMGRWQTTVASLRNLPQVEPPRRIVFVPEPGAGSISGSSNEDPWWRRMWNSGPQLGFASASVLALAILAHGLMARVPAALAPAQSAQMEALIHEAAMKEVDRLLPQAMDAALNRAMDQRLRTELRPALAGLKQQLAQEEQLHAAGLEQKRDADLKAIRYAFERLEQRLNYATLSSARPQGGE